MNEALIHVLADYEKPNDSCLVRCINTDIVSGVDRLVDRWGWT